jgi:hypothetical protein
LAKRIAIADTADAPEAPAMQTATMTERIIVLELRPVANRRAPWTGSRGRIGRLSFNTGFCRGCIKCCGKNKSGGGPKFCEARAAGVPTGNFTTVRRGGAGFRNRNGAVLPLVRDGPSPVRGSRRRNPPQRPRV